MRILIAVWLFWAPLLTLPRAVQAAGQATDLQPAASANIAPVYTVTPTAKGVVIAWGITPLSVNQKAAPPLTVTPATAQELLAAFLQQMSQQEYGGYRLPMRLEAVRLGEGQTVIEVEQIRGQPWTLPLVTATAPTPILPAGETLWTQAAITPAELPPSPLFLLREGRIRGQRVGIIAFSPLYQENGVIKVALDLRATLSNATLFPPLAPRVRGDEGGALFTAAPVALQPPPPGPTNPVVSGSSLHPAIKIHVRQAGIQKVQGAALLAAGLHEGSSLAQFHLTRRGVETALEIRDSDGQLDAATEIRFYAGPAAQSMAIGDRWNQTAVYWLTSESTPGLRMATRNGFPGLAPIRPSAYATGIWENNQIYESNMAGVDGDHWFAASMEVEAVNPQNPASYPVKTIALTQSLPLDVQSLASSVFTLTGSARSIATHTLNIQIGNVVQTLTWRNQDHYENWQHTISSTVPTAQLDLALVAGIEASMIRLDKVIWQQPVLLDFRQQGATFRSVGSLWRYQLQNTPPERTLYDVSNPLHPAIVQIPAGVKTQFEDGSIQREYLLSGPGLLHTPAVSVYQPAEFAEDEGADAVYIAPAQFQAALAPLIEHRGQQGYQVRLVDLQQIYDAWSYGEVAPEAIRDFLRFAVSHWQPAPIAVTLVGDSTQDPHNYMGQQDGVANTDILPAYWAPIDPWIGETSCELCFAQLDGASPLDRQYDAAMLGDIWLGRFSVQTVEQLQAVVRKILRYEQMSAADLTQPQRQHLLLVADNYIYPSGAKDPAGDFARFFDLLIEGEPERGFPPVIPNRMNVSRVYYDPVASGSAEPWREADAQKAHERTVAEVQAGPALIAYNGHGSAFQWATTDPNLDPPYMFMANDIYELTNFDHLSVVVELTCYSARFANVSRSGVTIDERFLHHANGGAVAVWGSAGLTVAVGHDAMMRGFLDKLWSLPPLTARVGELVAAGYDRLFTTTTCCQETRHVYLLLGDPLTPVMIWAPERLYLPLIANQ